MKARKKKGLITLGSDGRFTLAGDPPYSLPRELTDAFAESMLTSSPEDELFSGDIFKFLRATERQRFQQYCLDRGGKLKRLLIAFARQWSSLSYGNAGWRFDDSQILAKADVPAGWAEEFIYLDEGFYLVKTSTGYYTQAEFKRRYGYSPAAMLARESAKVDEQFARCVKLMESTVYKALVTVSTPDGLKRIECRGLSEFHPKDWRYPPGYEFVDIA